MKTHALRIAVPLYCLLLLAAAPRLGAQTAYLVRDIETSVAGPQGPLDPAGFISLGPRVLFTAYRTGHELWVTDGTAGGTELLIDAGAGGRDQGAQLLATAGNVGFFLIGAYPPGGGPAALWSSDGTRRGTRVLSRQGLMPRLPTYGWDLPYAVAGRFLYFPACDGAGTCSLARSDGSPAGTAFVTTSDFGYYGDINGMTAIGETVFFLTPRALWTSDGTAAGTHLVHDFGAVQSVQPLLAAAEHRIYFLASEGSPQVWTSDGTAAGTRAVTTYAASDPFRQTAWFKAAGDVVYFVADDVVHGAEIWTSDGTVAGTHAVTDFGYYDPFEYS